MVILRWWCYVLRGTVFCHIVEGVDAGLKNQRTSLRLGNSRGSPRAVQELLTVRLPSHSQSLASAPTVRDCVFQCGKSQAFGARLQAPALSLLGSECVAPM
jgi:hypothetical protein